MPANQKRLDLFEKLYDAQVALRNDGVVVPEFYFPLTEIFCVPVPLVSFEKTTPPAPEQSITIPVSTPAAVKSALAELSKAEAEKQHAASQVPYDKSAPTPPPDTTAKKLTKDDVGNAVRAAVALHQREKVGKVIKGFGVVAATKAPED